MKERENAGVRTVAFGGWNFDFFVFMDIAIIEQDILHTRILQWSVLL